MTIRCYAESGSWGSEIVLSESESHHLKHVLRAGVGANVIVMDGCGREADAEVVGETGRFVRLKPGVIRRDQESGLSIHLLTALIKGQKMDWLIQKATEIGVRAIIPVQTERCVVRLKDAQTVKRCERWRQIALNGMKQCGTPFLPAIGPVLSFSRLLADFNQYDVVILCSLAEDTRELHAVIDELRLKNLRRIGVMIGPEGDFTESELGRAIEAGAVPVTLGRNVLRAETAPLVITGILQYEWTRSPWGLKER